MKKLLLLLIPFLAFADLSVVVSDKSSLKSLDKSEIEKIFLSKSNTNVIPVESSDSSAKELFYKNIANKNLSQLRSYWAKQIFTGKARPPEQLSFEQILLKLKSTTNTISYIPSTKVAEELKVLYRVE